MLAAAGLTFEVRPPRIPEPLLEDCPPQELPVVLAQAKAAAALRENPGRVVVAADQVVLMPDGRVAAAPEDRDAAARQLTALQGRTHRLVSAAVVRKDAEEHVVVDQVSMTIRALSALEVERVLDWNEWQGCAGAYRFEGRGVHLVERWDGDHFCVLGLPLVPLLKVLRLMGFGSP